ncbi:MAG: P27 family phage terminase small subunit [Solobacterium sp.]|jgi:P27 family predicted phage terminase small subunit|nr:P27 family phage terminase small subunit [Solobacterium sp.]MCH4205297.1 P27 family phage terminase small subunit [Solobacterium sp.]MCH4226890.1 P27 family phage terminase small subunit [Solobacterium sp.]MCH4281650.1 P27 family phage terminase small subunit [Solobacterium sp.]
MPAKTVAVEKTKKHLSKAQIQAKKAVKTRVKALKNAIEPPDYLTSDQRKEFDVVVALQAKVGLVSALDVDTIASYVISRDNYYKVSAQMNELSVTSDAYGKISRLQDRYFKQMRATQNALGMSPESRNRLSVPSVDPVLDTEKKVNKFDKFVVSH